MLSFSQLRELFVETFNDWNEDKAPRLAAALSYYTIFSLAPLLIIVISIAGLVFGEQAAQGQIFEQIRGVMGRQGAEAVQGLLESANRPTTGTISAIIGFATLLFGAAGLFGQLKDAMNTIWEVAPKPNRGIWGMVQDNFLSFSMVLGVGFLLLVSLIVSAALAAAVKYFAGEAAGQSVLWSVVNFVVQLAVTFGLFALIFKVLPDAEITWHDVLLGAAVTAVLFALGRFAISLYIGQTATGSTFGAAGSLVVILVWVYFSAQILFFGAELTQVYAQKYGSHIEPSPNAVAATEDMRAQQGMPDPVVLAATAKLTEGKPLEEAERRAIQAAIAEPQPDEAEQGAPRERAVGERERAAGQAPRQEPAQAAAGPAYARGGYEAAPGPYRREEDGGPGVTVLAGATLAGIVGALLAGAVRRRRER